MKVYANRLGETLKKGLHPIYIVSGDEPLLVQEASDLITLNLRKNGFSERELFHVESGFDWNSVLYSVNSLSLFAEQKIIEVRMSTTKPGDKGSETLIELVRHLGGDTALLLVLPKLEAATQRAKWFKSIEAAGVFVQIWPIDTPELPAWLDSRFKKAGLKASRESIRIMAGRIEGNLLAAVQEIERLKLISTNGQVEISDIATGVADSARFDVFKLIDAALIGDAKRIVRMLNGLRAEGVEVLFVVSMLSRELRSLEEMSVALANGHHMRDVLKKGRVWDKRVAGVSRCLERHSSCTLTGLQLSLGTVDRMVKGIVVGDPWRELITIFLGVANVTTVATVTSADLW